MNPAEQPVDTLLLTGAFLPTLCVLLLGSVTQVNQSEGALHSAEGSTFHTVLEWEVEFMNTPNLEDMGCGTSSATKDKKSEKGEFQECACLPEWKGEGELGSSSAPFSITHMVLKLPREIFHQTSSLELKVKYWDNVGNYL